MSQKVRDPELERERSTLADNLERLLEWPLVVLAAIWLALLVVELVNGISPALERIGLVIWGIFIIEFVLRFVVAAHKTDFLKKNWLTLLTLILPAIRVLRVFRIARAVRGVRLVRILGSVNRGMNSLGQSMRRRGLPYVAALTLLVLILGAAGMYAFEQDAAPAVMGTYGDALWWTAMLLTTIGSDYWPRTAEGRVLTLFLSLYALAILGYVAASLASFFIGRDAEDKEASVAGARELELLREEISSLKVQLTQTGRE